MTILGWFGDTTILGNIHIINMSTLDVLVDSPGSGYWLRGPSLIGKFGSNGGRFNVTLSTWSKLVLRLDLLYFMSVRKYPREQIAPQKSGVLRKLFVGDASHSGKSPHRRAASTKLPQRLTNSANIRNLTATTSFQVGASFQTFSLPQTNKHLKMDGWKMSFL